MNEPRRPQGPKNGERNSTENPPPRRNEIATNAEHDDGSAVYGALLKEELEGQESRKTSFEQRGLAVVTTAGALVTLLFGLAAISTKTANAKPFTTAEKSFLAAALILFVGAAICALLTNWPLKYEGLNLNGVEKRLKESPMNDQAGAHRDIAFTQIKILRAAKLKNRRKGRYLYAAMACEVLAVLCVGIAVFEVINP